MCFQKQNISNAFYSNLTNGFLTANRCYIHCLNKKKSDFITEKLIKSVYNKDTIKKGGLKNVCCKNKQREFRK